MKSPLNAELPKKTEKNNRDANRGITDNNRGIAGNPAWIPSEGGAILARRKLLLRAFCVVMLIGWEGKCAPPQLSWG
jgi:hypothetical protein